MINSLVSIKVVLQEIIRDLGLGQTPIPTSDMKEWIIEALKHIGAGQQFRQEIRQIEIKNFKGELPCETYKVVHLLESWKYRYNENLSRDDDTESISLEDQNNLVAVTEFDYRIEFQEVLTSFETGEMNFKLMLYPVDEDGFLLIPDSVSYKDALMWKIAYQLGIRGHKFANPQMSDIRFTGNKWNFYCKQSRGVARMGDARVLEMFARSMNRLVPDYDQYHSDFRGLNDREQLILDNRSTPIKQQPDTQ